MTYSLMTNTFLCNTFTWPITSNHHTINCKNTFLCPLLLFLIVSLTDNRLSLYLIIIKYERNSAYVYITIISLSLNLLLFLSFYLLSLLLLKRFISKFISKFIYYVNSLLSKILSEICKICFLIWFQNMHYNIRPPKIAILYNNRESTMCVRENFEKSLNILLNIQFL